jgi:putative transposase
MDGHRLLCVEDGSKALRNAVKRYWPDAEIQRCLVHKERNLRRYLPRRLWGELNGLMNRLRKAEGKADGQTAYDALRRFLNDHNQAALESLMEAGDDLLSLHRLGVSHTRFRTSLQTSRYAKLPGGDAC